MFRQNFSNAAMRQGRANWAVAAAPMAIAFISNSAGAEPLTLGNFYTCGYDGIAVNGDGSTWCIDLGSHIDVLAFAPSEGGLTYAQANNAVTQLGGGLGFEIPTFDRLNSFMQGLLSEISNDGSVPADYLLYGSPVHWLAGGGAAYDVETGTLVEMPTDLNGGLGMRSITTGGNVPEPGSLALISVALVAAGMAGRLRNATRTADPAP